MVSSSLDLGGINADFALINVSRQKRGNLMGFSCEHFPKVCQSCAAQKSVIPTLPANTEATILKEGWRSCGWQLARQCPGSEFSRALAVCLDSETRRRILAKDLARTDVAPERGHGLVTRLLHDDELPNAVHRRLGHASGAEGVTPRADQHSFRPELQLSSGACRWNPCADRAATHVHSGRPNGKPRPP